MSDLKSQILEADDRPHEDVEVEEWGVTVRLRGLSGRGAEEFARRFGDAGSDPPKDVVADLLVRTLEDPDTGEPIFEEDERDLVASKAAQVNSRLFRVAQNLSGLGDLDEAKND